jgi:anthranilate synthase/aminodeoxychorismate synthase-like glutamine amidotransferase
MAPSVDPGMAVILLDNRDSFTWNLAQAFQELGAAVDVVDSADVTAPAILSQRPRLVCIGPGPRGPADLPHLLDVVRGLDGEVPLFGVCLGLQALVRAHGGEVGRARAPVHGKRAAILHGGAGVLAGLPTPLWVMRYHSLVATTVPARVEVTARDADGQVMAIRDARACIEAVQFHPESIGTAGGMEILRSALADAGVRARPVVARRGSVPAPGSKGPGHEEALYGAAAPAFDGPEVVS